MPTAKLNLQITAYYIKVLRLFPCESFGHTVHISIKFIFNGRNQMLSTQALGEIECNTFQE